MYDDNRYFIEKVQLSIAAYVYIVLSAGILLVSTCTTVTIAAPGRWNPKTTDWSQNPIPVIGDWGFNRPGYPPGLYIHGVTVKAGEKMMNPVIYDNDDDERFYGGNPEFLTIKDDEFIAAKATLGEANYIGLVCTPVMAAVFDDSHATSGYIQGWVDTMTDSRARLPGIGMCDEVIPPLTVGAKYYQQPYPDEPGVIAVVDMINAAYAEDPTRPVIYNIGGQSNTIASAYVRDPSIGDKVIIYYTSLIGYNGHEEWASAICAREFRTVAWGWDQYWWNKQCCGYDAFYDGTFIHAWRPDCFLAADLEEVRFYGTGAHVIHIKDYSPQAFHEAGSAWNDPEARDGECPVTLPPPTDLVATVAGSQIELSWTDNSSGDVQEDAFHIQRKPYLGQDDPWQDIGSVGPDITSFSDTGLLYGMVMYWYRVGAFKSE